MYLYYGRYIITKNYLQWDNSGKGYNSQQDRAFYESGVMGTIPSGRTENKINITESELAVCVVIL